MEDINSWHCKFTPCQYSDKLLNKLNFLNQKVRFPVDINEITKAIYYARKYHGSQMRQSGEPYYSHPIEVALIMAEYLFSTNHIITAILHDTIEDTVLTKDKISSIFNELIANQVMDLTRVKENGRKISSEEMVERLFLERKYDVSFIKICDRIHNLQTLQVKSPEKAKKIVEETLTHIIALGMQLQIPLELKRQIIKLCYQHLSIKQFPLLKEWKTMVAGDFHLPQPAYKSGLNQICSQYLSES